MSLIPLIAILNLGQAPEPTPWPFVVKTLEGKGILGLPLEISPLPHIGYVVEVVLDRSRKSVGRIIMSNAEVEWHEEALSKLRATKRLDPDRDALFSLLIRQTVSVAEFRSPSLSIYTWTVDEVPKGEANHFASVVIGEVGKSSEHPIYFLSRKGTVLRKFRPGRTSSVDQ